ncbi:hypothetical protein Lal_00012196 [Lupinus albus]|nr:hypothetical protein Lal_00012196 [Lupinus albus]
MLQRAASNAYSWWWASHIRTKQSKWMEQNLQVVLRPHHYDSMSHCNCNLAAVSCDAVHNLTQRDYDMSIYG